MIWLTCGSILNDGCRVGYLLFMKSMLYEFKVPALECIQLFLIDYNEDMIMISVPK